MMHIMNSKCQQTGLYSTGSAAGRSSSLPSNFVQPQTLPSFDVDNNNMCQSSMEQERQKRDRAGVNVSQTGSTYSVPTNFGYNNNNNDDDDSAIVLQDQQSSGKRSRVNSYRATETKTTVTSVVGSLALSSSGSAISSSITSVGMRRQLSSGQLDQFMSQGGDDTMDEDPTASTTRERAMSF